MLRSYKCIVNSPAARNALSYVVRSLHKDFRPCTILGIETSCDDTGCAIVDHEGTILGEALQSQEHIHLQHGGIIPPIAEEHHRKNIASVVERALGKYSLNDIDAIAVTTQPGLPLSLQIGTKYAKHIARKHQKPLIPIHHMEAHALTIRMRKEIQFPFLVLLISGGHCLLAVAKSVREFFLLGQSIDDAPGEAFDKLARRMKLRNLPEFSSMSGGQAMEVSASRATDPLQHRMSAPMLQYKDCNFSFAGLKNVVQRKIMKEEKEFDLAPDEVIPNAYNLAAALQVTITRHLCHRVQRAMEFCKLHGLATNNQLVVSGGVACNNFINRGLQIVCTELGYTLHRPEPKLCTDNGIMIAWNGVEKWQTNCDITTDYESIHIRKSSPLGVNLIPQVQAANISCKWVRLKGIEVPQTPEDIELAKMAGRT
ncbi:tRNA N6-adenosine threonylcarbamoyltransferase, mitochondrial [Atheta coriaria]|uniref:tRNA N6-adenosine threonylcarbamoyltransferase, mitochondrial n=1 Tax=Dalotia coriaria TaxID=877792 RepID=UPI0031F41DA2